MIKVYKIFLLILVLILLSTFNPNKFEISYKTKDNFFKIEKIIILNNSLVKKDIILKRLDQLYGKNIFLIKRKNIEESIKNISFLEKIEVKKKYPSTVKIKIFETKPIGVVFKDKKKYLLDSSSNLIEYDETTLFKELPNIFGDLAEENFVDFFNDLKKNRFPINKIKNFYFFQVGRWDLQLFDNITIKFPHKVSEKLIKKTTKLLNRKDFQNYKIIDLRVPGKIIVE
tara:strand:- start:1668 stop:2351 length:684 start_codon:yes stop_codon:yes gene_type:complete